QSGAWVQGTETGPDGSYMHRVPGGKQHLYLAMSTPPPGFRMPAQTAYDLTVRDGETVTIDFKLPRGRKPRLVRGRVLGPNGKPGESRELSPLILQVADRSVAGRVVDANGDPFVGAQVNLDGRDTAQQYKAADSEGRFRFESVVDEKVRLSAYSPGHQWAEKKV